MKSRQIKILVLLLAASVVAAAFFLRPQRFHVDKTQYELVSLHKPKYKSSQVFAINGSGVAVGRIEYPDGKVEIVKWDSNGQKERIPLPDNVKGVPGSINDKGDIVGSYGGK